MATYSSSPKKEWGYPINKHYFVHRWLDQRYFLDSTAPQRSKGPGHGAQREPQARRGAGASGATVHLLGVSGGEASRKMVKRWKNHSEKNIWWWKYMETDKTKQGKMVKISGTLEKILGNIWKTKLKRLEKWWRSFNDHPKTWWRSFV